MPIKTEKGELQCFYMTDDGEYKPIGHISEDDLILSENDSMPFYINMSPMEFSAEVKGNMEAFFIFLSTGNDLYLRFPKKLRRRRKR